MSRVHVSTIISTITAAARSSCFAKISEPKSSKQQQQHRLSCGEEVAYSGVHGIVEAIGADIEVE